jgi:hypothetical protein
MTDAAVLTDRFDRALLYATHVHGGQVRKATFVPYIAHAVTATVLEYNGSELDFGRFRRREREHFPCAARYGTEFLYCLGLAGT